MVNMRSQLVEGLETAAIWCLPSCTRKYLDPKVQHPNSHSFTTKISSVFTLTDSTVFNRIIMPFRNMGVFQRRLVVCNKHLEEETYGSKESVERIK